MMIFNKFKLGFFSIVGYLYKLLVDIKLLNVPDLKPENGVDVIVSLTSYGRRVRSNVVYYTLVSLLRQDVQPAHIILWLADSEWNEMTIPRKLKSLETKGVEICYYKDVRSYKKLIPTLVKYPDKTIVTVDDDVIYSKDLLTRLIEEHKAYPRDIICMACRMPLMKKDGLSYNYREWPELKENHEGKILFPVGVGGTLYPAGSLSEEVLNENVFLKYCPLADDVWFWFCGMLNKTNKRYIKKKGRDYSFDSLYQYFHKSAALTYANNLGHQNDEQIKKLFDYYNFVVNNVIM